MNFFEILLLDVILLLFPLMLYFIYGAYSKTLDFSKNNLCLDLSLFSSYYLLVRIGNLEINSIPILILDIVLLISFLKRKKVSIILLSGLLIMYYYNFFNINIFILIYEYLLYIFIYLYLYKDKILLFTNYFIIIKSIMFFICFILSNNIKSDLILIIILFILLAYFVINIYIRTDKIFSLYKQVKSIEKEEQIKKSLFKITHEIKNPIAVCKGYLDMFDMNNIEHSKKYVPIIKSEINRVLALLEDFLSITKIKIEKEEMDINVLLEDTIYCLNPLLKDKNVDFEYNISDDEIYIEADYNRLKQTLVNIIKNSLESINSDGYIKLSTKKDNNQVKIIIEDNGVGMSEDELSKIKEAFFTTKKNGTGLGIYMSNEIIKLHNGSLDYFSEKSKGTKVVITLPA